MLWPRTWGKGRGDGTYKRWSGLTATKPGLHTWSYILSYCRKCHYIHDYAPSIHLYSHSQLRPSGSASTPITLRPYSSILSPSLSHAMFPVWSPSIFSLWHPNPDSLHCYLSVPLTPSCLVLKCHWLTSTPITSYTPACHLSPLALSFALSLP